MANVLRVKNWTKFQHYKHRRPPWIRLYHNLLDDYEYQTLPLASRALAPMLWLLASEHSDGEIPFNAVALAFRLHIDPVDFSQALKPLIDRCFVELCGDACANASKLLPQSTETETERANTYKSNAVKILTQ